jgi:hypothetical protein
MTCVMLIAIPFMAAGFTLLTDRAWARRFKQRLTWGQTYAIGYGLLMSGGIAILAAGILTRHGH